MSKELNQKDKKRTVWRNDNDIEAHFKYCDHESDMINVDLMPGESVEIDSRCDQAIQYVQNGIVEGGVCPWLTKLDDKSQPVKHRKMAVALDYKRAQALEDVDSIEQRQAERDKLERVKKYEESLKKGK